MRYRKNRGGVLVPEDKVLCSASGMLAGGFYSQGGGGGLTKALDTNITSGNAVVYTTTKEVVTDQSTYINTYDYIAYGFDAGSDYWAYGPGFGSIANGTYTDAGSTSRLVDSCYFVQGSVENSIDSLWFVLDTTSVPDTDTVFKYIVIDGNQYNRADRAFYYASADGGTAWTWEFDPSGTNPFAGANPDPFEVWVE